MADLGGAWVKGKFMSSKMVEKAVKDGGHASKESFVKAMGEVGVEGVQAAIDLVKSQGGYYKDKPAAKSSEYKQFSPTNAADAHIDFQPPAQAWKSSLTKEQEWAIKQYVDGKYAELNKLLREGKFDPDKFPNSALSKMTKALDDAIATSPGLPQNTILFRGFNSQFHHDLVTNGIKKGTVIEEKQFLSTSPKKGTSEGFKHGGSDQVFYEIRAKKGKKGAYLSWQDINPYMHESEFLLPRGSKLKVRKASFKNIDGQKVAYFELDLV